MLYKIKAILFHFITSLPIRICYLLELQLFINILALPVLLSWGLPISLLSPIGNLIFGPWLIMFLTLSSLLFFMQILNINNSIIIYLLEKLNQLFLLILNFGSKSYMTSCPCPSKFILLLIPLSLFYLIKIQKSHIYLRLITLFLFSCFLFASLKYMYSPKEVFEYFTNKNKTILVIHHDSKNILLDLGALAEGRSAQTWTKFQLIPALLKSNINHIDCLIVPYPSGKAFESIKELSKNIDIHHLYLQKWIGHISSTGWKHWKEILDLVKQKQLALIFLTKPLKINLSKNFKITATPKDALIKKSTLKYKTTEIKVQLNQETLQLIPTIQPKTLSNAVIG